MNENHEKFLKYVHELQMLNERYLKDNELISCMVLVTREGASGFSIISNTCPSCMIASYITSMMEHPHRFNREDKLEDMEVSDKKN